ncbi:MAG TPA: type II toxin-antitoxin system MqsR family toxin [Longimicrobium sp.]|nr:type II toxin-antitoxin system MqsR family toxin [Longimicrobium sp.]
MRRRHGHAPKFSLARVQELVRLGEPHVHITMSAVAGARALYMSAGDIVDCISDMTEEDYEQTLESISIPGTFQDVYKPRYEGFAIYLKVRMVEDRQTIVISFKRNESP